MKKLLFLLILSLLPSLTYAFDVGVDFRSTSGYVTDPTNFTYNLTETYPTTRGGITSGWDAAGVGSRDRSTTVADKRLAGVNFTNNDGASQRTFKYDLPATGTYNVCVAMGDETSDQQYQYIQFRDNTTAFATVDDSNGTLADHFDDASGVDRTGTAWPGSQVCVTHTFTSTSSQSVMGTPNAQAGVSTIASIEIISVSTATPSPARFSFLGRVFLLGKLFFP